MKRDPATATNQIFQSTPTTLGTLSTCPPASRTARLGELPFLSATGDAISVRVQAGKDSSHIDTTRIGAACLDVT